MMNSQWKVRTSIGHLFLVTLLGLPLLTPLWHWATNPCTHDGHLHIHRVAAMRHAWENGIFFSRWIPDLAFGYGYPFFIYREPGPLYALLLPHLLGIPLPAASNLFYALTILASGWFMFLWARDVLGPRSGIVSAVAYMAAPYILLDALVRGNAPESLALPLFPFLLWIGRRWMINGSLWPFLLSVFGLAFLSLSHNISILIFTPVLLVYLLLIGWLHKLPWRSLLIRLLLLFGLGLGLTFFYSGGALLEMDQVTLSQSTITRNNDFHYNFASLAEILASPTAENPNLLNPPLPIRLGLVPAILALFGASKLFWKKYQSREQRWHITLMIIGAGLFLFMSMPISLPFWENLPLIDFVQFPWRFIGRAALPVAFLAGALFAGGKAPTDRDHRGKRRQLLSQAALVTAVTLLLLEALPALYPRQCTEEMFPTIQNVHNYERSTGLVGVDPEGSYFPRTVRQRPKGSPLEVDYQNGNVPQRFDMTVLPPGSTAELSFRPLSASMDIDASTPFTARYYTFAFPGWVARIDGQKVDIIPGDPDGLITFPVPAGKHTVLVSWQSTPLRTSLSIASLLSLVGIIITAIWLWRNPPPAHARNAQEEALIPEFWPLIILVLGIFIFQNLVVNRGWTPWLQAGDPPVEHSQALHTEELRLVGFNLSDDRVAAGENFTIDMAWMTSIPTLKEFQSNVWLSGPDGLFWSEKETYRPRQYEDAPPTWEREAGQWVWDSREIQVLPGTPPGTYDVILTLFDLATLQPQTLVNEGGGIVGPTAVIGQIRVGMPDSPPEYSPQFKSQEMVPGSGLILTGYNQDRETADPGESLLLTLFWDRTADPILETIALQLKDSAGATVHEWVVPLIRTDFDLASWAAGELLRGQYPLRLPPDLESGTYQIILEETVPLGEIAITAPDRIFEPPAYQNALGVPFAGAGTLVGYTAGLSPSGMLDLALIWQADLTMDTSYHVFVHLVDASGRLISQSDGQPANWSRPTTGWVPGEYIVDTHALTLPPNTPPSSLTLRVGLYDPGSGQRLIAGDSEFATFPFNN